MLSPLRLWTAALLLVGMAVVLASYRDFGITWDEPVQARYGETVLAYFEAGFQGPVALAEPDLVTTRPPSSCWRRSPTPTTPGRSTRSATCCSA